MDTTWYAVDADGFVGEFQTGEDGALPTSATAGPEGGDFDSWPFDAIVVARALAEGTFPEAESDIVPPRYPVCVVLALRPDPDEEGPATYRDAADRRYSVQRILGDDVVVLRDADPRVVCTTKPLDPGRLAELASDRRVERMVLQDEIWDWAYEGGGPVYRFSNVDYGNPGSYQRLNEPDHAIRTDGLPPELEETISKLSLPVRFADAAEIHLADYLSDEECVTWGETTLRGEPLEPSAPSTGGPPSGMEPRTARLILLALAVAAVLLALLWLAR
jgi:hypothetical protein